jgi:hypothetical protein
LAAWYVADVVARPKVLELMTVDDFYDLLDDGVAVMPDFKTQSTYLVQPLFANEWMQRLVVLIIVLYLFVLIYTYVLQSSTDVLCSHAPLCLLSPSLCWPLRCFFLSFAGTPIKNIGVYCYI